MINYIDKYVSIKDAKYSGQEEEFKHHLVAIADPV